MEPEFFDGDLVQIFFHPLDYLGGTQGFNDSSLLFWVDSNLRTSPWLCHPSSSFHSFFAILWFDELPCQFFHEAALGHMNLCCENWYEKNDIHFFMLHKF